jgi:hypothetical protein
LKTSRLLLLAIVLGALFSDPLPAQATPESDFTADAQADYQSLINYINDRFAGSMGFVTSAGWNTPTQVYDIVSGPRVEVGVGLGVDFINLPGLNSISLNAVQLSSNANIPAVLPFPFPVITGKIGLMNGLDLGVKFNYLPMINLPDLGFEANFLGWGLDLRYKLVEGATAPTVVVGVSFDDMSGNLSIGTPINQSGSYYDSNTATTYSINFTGSNNYDLSWSTKTFGAQLQAGKDLGMVYPFAAIGFQRSSGSITSTMKGSGTLTVSPNPSTPVSISAVSSSAPVLFEPKYVLGLDFGMGLHWAIVGESNGTDIAASTSFRVQF